MAVSSWNDNGQVQFVHDPGKILSTTPSFIVLYSLKTHVTCYIENLCMPHLCLYVLQKLSIVQISSLDLDGCCLNPYGMSYHQSGLKHILVCYNMFISYLITFTTCISNVLISSLTWLYLLGWLGEIEGGAQRSSVYSPRNLQNIQFWWACTLTISYGTIINALFVIVVYLFFFLFFVKRHQVHCGLLFNLQ